MINNIIITDILKDLNVDIERSFDSFDNNEYLLDLFFKRSNDISCSNCGSTSLFIKSSKITKTKFANTKLIGAIPTNLHRRVFKCSDCNHYQIESNTLSFHRSKRLSD